MSPYSSTRTTSSPARLKVHGRDSAGVPWIVRPVSGKTELKLPYGANNRAWLKSGFGKGKRLQVELVKTTNSWLIATDHFGPAARALAYRYGRVEVYMQFNTTGTCSSSCQGAKGKPCVCFCRGENHGGGIAPSVGWKLHGEVPVAPGLVEVHSTLRSGHSLDGMFA